MEHQPTSNNTSQALTLDSLIANEIAASAGLVADQYENFSQQHPLSLLNDIVTKLSGHAGKKSFLVYKNNKYLNVLTENIAFFAIKYDSAVIICFDKQEYFVDYSLDQIQNLLPKKQFYRLNRQYLINFSAIVEVEHYFARKLLVNPVLPVEDKLIVSKEKVSEFLHWLDNR